MSIFVADSAAQAKGRSKNAFREVPSGRGRRPRSGKGQWTVGKNFDGTGGFWPAVVTADELRRLRW
jgi:hypothetical protein